VPYTAIAIVRTADGWSGSEVDLDGVEDLDSAADLLRDLIEEENAGPALLFVEENDEYFVVVRVQSPDETEARAFISDSRATETSELAASLYDESAIEPILDDDEKPDDEDDEGTAAPEAEPGGDDTILADLGTKATELRKLCAVEGMLPADVIYSLCERGGFVDVLEELRGA
jgi:putative tRNA adenosine deaminase-associated protein